MSRRIAGALALGAWGAASVLGGDAPACAQQPAIAVPAEAESAYNAAAARDAEIAGAEAELRAAQLRARSVGVIFEGAPSATLSYRNDRSGSGLGYREYEAEVSAPIFLPGERNATQRAAAARRDAAAARLELARLDLASRLRAAWWARERAQASVQIARRQAVGATELATATSRLTDAGVQARLDLVQVEALTAEIEAAAITAEADFVAADTAWRALVGNAAVSFLDATVPAEAVLADHPLVRLRRAEQVYGEAAAQQAALAGFPSPEIGLLARRERDAFGQTEVDSFGVMVRVPLGRDPGTRAAASEARAIAARARAALVQDRRVLDGQLATARSRLAAAERTLAVAQRRQTSLAEALELAERGRGEGALGFIEFLRARSALAEAQRAAALAVIDRTSAQSAVAQALGILP
jgi:outer membrane protein, heavy metal efflux system